MALSKYELESLQREVELDEDVVLIVGLVYCYLKKKKQKRRHRWWVHDILRGQQQFGSYHHLMKELELDSEQFKRYFRLTKEQFEHVLMLTVPSLEKISLTRKAGDPKERLAVCLRYLATGETFRSLAFSFCLGATTVANIVAEVCKVIWDKMKDLYMAPPKTSNNWRINAENFENMWNFPNLIGAIDGKHVVMNAPDNTGSLYYNYKNTFSMVLLALVDANLQFIYIDIGSYGRNSDGGIFAHSSLGKALAAGKLNLPPDTPLPGAQHLGSVPYVIVGDEAFPLQKNLLRPFPGKNCTADQRHITID